MKYPRVNLLKKSEQRYQGAVSRRFMLISIVATPIFLIAILSGVKLIQFGGVQSNLKSSREIWVDLKPRLSLYEDEQRGLNTNKEALALIEGWKNTQVSQHGLISEIQVVVPGNIQLTRLSIRSQPGTSIYAEPEDFGLKYKLMLQGIAEGSRAENSVIGLRRNLLDMDLMKATFESVKLASLRKRSGKEGQNMREFLLEGFSPEGEE
jgi:hypothetical protein